MPGRSFRLDEAGVDHLRPLLARLREELDVPGAFDADALAEAERAASADPRALGDYRAGRSVHPLLPFRDWNACQPALGRLGAVLVAGAADATSVRQLGFVPAHNLGAALDLARGQGHTRIGYLLGPPYFPLRVGPA